MFNLIILEEKDVDSRCIRKSETNISKCLIKGRNIKDEVKSIYILLISKWRERQSLLQISFYNFKFDFNVLCVSTIC